jgi:hypothetical protein
LAGTWRKKGRAELTIPISPTPTSQMSEQITTLSRTEKVKGQRQVRGKTLGLLLYPGNLRCGKEMLSIKNTVITVYK